jgi:hypothetical protein
VGRPIHPVSLPSRVRLRCGCDPFLFSRVWRRFFGSRSAYSRSTPLRSVLPRGFSFSLVSALSLRRLGSVSPSAVASPRSAPPRRRFPLHFRLEKKYIFRQIVGKITGSRSQVYRAEVRVSFSVIFSVFLAVLYRFSINFRG